MGTTLTGTKPKDTYDSLIKVTDNGPISGTAKYLSDGLGNDLPISVSTTNVGIGTSSPAQALDVNGSIRAVGGSYDPTTSAWINAAFATKVSASPYGGGFSLIDGTSGWTQYVIGAGANLVFAQGATSGAPSTYATLTNGGYFRLSTGGIQFNNDTAAANALDDYEEGTFTPTATSGITINQVVNATYTKIGNLVSFQIWLKVNITSADWVIDGLPISASGRTTNAISNINQKEALANQTVGTNVYAYASSVANGVDLFIGGNYRVA
jgi:hypothetical protein